MAETYLIRFSVKPDQRHRFLDLLENVLEAMQHEDTFIAAHLSESSTAPNHFVLHESWSDRDDVVNVQLNRAYRRDWHDALPGLLLEDRQIEILAPIWPHGDGASA